MKLSVVIPARGEGDLCMLKLALNQRLDAEHIPHEIVISRDDGEPHGYGLAVRNGIKRATGDVVAVFMADGSDSVGDLVDYYRIIQRGYDAAFGTRWYKGHRPTDYPWPKLILNRIANHAIMWLFGILDNDVTNAFKAYRMDLIEKMMPLESKDFELTVEMPLKAYILGAKVAHPPISWRNRKVGKSKWNFHEMGSKYVRTILKLWWSK